MQKSGNPVPCSIFCAKFCASATPISPIMVFQSRKWMKSGRTKTVLTPETLTDDTDAKMAVLVKSTSLMQNLRFSTAIMVRGRFIYQPPPPTVLVQKRLTATSDTTSATTSATTATSATISAVSACTSAASTTAFKTQYRMQWYFNTSHRITDSSKRFNKAS